MHVKWLSLVYIFDLKAKSNFNIGCMVKNELFLKVEGPDQMIYTYLYFLFSIYLKTVNN